MSSDSESGWLAGFKADYQAIFVEEWSPFVGAMLLVLTIIGLMLSGLGLGACSAASSSRGDWFNNPDRSRYPCSACRSKPRVS